MAVKKLSWTERLKIESLNDAGLNASQIARQLGRSHTTIIRELKRGAYKKLTSDWKEVETYSADKGQAVWEKTVKNRGTKPKAINNKAMLEYIEKLMVNEQYSPYAVAEKLKEKEKEFGMVLCESSIYNYLYKGYFPALQLADLPCKKNEESEVIGESKKGLQEVHA